MTYTNVTERPVRFYAITGAWVIIMCLLTYLAWQHWYTNTGPTSDVSFSLGQVISAGIILWTALSIRALRVNEVGAVVLWGTPMLRVRRGPKFVVFGIFQLARFKASVINNQFPADPELIQKTPDEVQLETIEVLLEDGTTVKRTKVRPIRITTARPNADLAKDDILNSQQTVEFTFWVRWLVTDAFPFILNTGGSFEESIRQMRDTGESLLNVEVTKCTPSELISGFDDLQTKLRNAIIAKMEPWGITIEGVGLTAPDLNHEVASALRDITKAKAEREKTIINAAAERKRLAEEGKGRGEAKSAELAGEGRGYKRAAEFIGVDAKTMLDAQVARDVVGESDLILGVEGITQAIGLGKRLLGKNERRGQRRTDKGENS